MHRGTNLHLKIVHEGLYIQDENNEIKILSEANIKANYKHIRCGFTSNGIPINFISGGLKTIQIFGEKTKWEFT